MTGWTSPLSRAFSLPRRLSGVVVRLRASREGNTLPLVAASVAPLLALVGGGIDMSRSYLAETRLQQACDAGVLAARKELGSQVVLDGEVPSSVSERGNRFFNANFRPGSYGTRNADFRMELEDDYQIAGRATVEVPTTIMGMFGYGAVPVEVSCKGKLSFSNTDIMMVLDVTGSMNETNPGDSETRIDTLKDVVRDFHTQLEGGKHEGSRIRYGFVPYSTNVNVGHLLRDEWVVSNWTYQSRELVGTALVSGTFTYQTAGSPVSGLMDETLHNSYAATLISGVPTCTGTLPAGTLTTSSVLISTTSTPVTTPLAGTKTVQTYHITYNGISYRNVLSGSTCKVIKRTHTNWKLKVDQVTEPRLSTMRQWDYRPISYNVANWRTETAGCIEERDTYDINDYDRVDLRRAIDLDIDRVPDAGDPDTQWRPMYPERVFARTMQYNMTGGFSLGVSRTTAEYISPARMYTAACPPRAQKLQEMDSAQLESYLATLAAGGSTYHDIGMIWGGRLLSPTGIFAAENADVSASNATGRHLVFLTDGQTSALDISYSSYGMEPLDRRRWSPSSSLSLTDTVEARFAFACKEVKKRNITVWVIAFGTDLNPVMEECAGPGRSFQADDGDQLGQIFVKIANAISELRLTK
ncbi:MAG TPA: pilus assembly protein TadG-related protein [Novosphingobium sp.]|nr:pilus assembly protein TadG-related protein [Novosphingobium sp.]